jgi:hypothetical protein
MAMSCSDSTKEKTTPMVKISFNQSIASGGYMKTKAENVFISIIEEHTNKYVEVTLVNKETQEVFLCNSNESIVVPMGTYEISAKYTPEALQSEINNFAIYNTPPLKCDAFEIRINNQTTSVTLNVYYDCYAIFAKIKECQTATVHSFNMQNIRNHYYVIYCKGTTNFTLLPYYDTEFIPTEFKFATDETVDCAKYVEIGRYYVIQPDVNYDINTPFKTEIQNMVEGTI